MACLLSAVCAFLAVSISAAAPLEPDALPGTVPILDHTAGYIFERAFQQKKDCEIMLPTCAMECKAPSWCSCDHCHDLRGGQYCYICNFVVDDPERHIRRVRARYLKVLDVIKHMPGFVSSEESKQDKVLKGVEMLLAPTGSNSSSNTYFDALLESLDEAHGSAGATDVMVAPAQVALNKQVTVTVTDKKDGMDESPHLSYLKPPVSNPADTGSASKAVDKAAFNVIAMLGNSNTQG